MRLAVIGADGHIGTVFGGRRPFTLAGVACANVPCENTAAVKRLAGSHGAEFYSDWREMVRQAKPDACAVSTTYPFNGAITAELLRQGIAVYEEKPAAADAAILADIAATQKESGALLFSMLSLRYDPWFATAKRLIDSGAVGIPRMVTGQKSYKMGKRPEAYFRRETYGSTICWVAIHALDQVLWLTALPWQENSVNAMHSYLHNGGHGTMEATSVMQFSLSGETCACIHADLLRPQNAPSHGDDRIRVAGTEGVLEVRDNKVWLINAGNDGTVPVPLDTCEPMFDHFIRLYEDAALRALPFYRNCDGIDAAALSIACRDAADAFLKGSSV